MIAHPQISKPLWACCTFSPLDAAIEPEVVELQFTTERNIGRGNRLIAAMFDGKERIFCENGGD
ncbi:hypothetical protein ABH999_000671 [Bradyrhizobium yuanmingense]|uniref:hypothetical protein n=1 Tax=Bradyrhizobium yuanmingense TaxID=108015 RepID=UPI0035191278